MKPLLKRLSSLHITVWLLAFSMVLIFIGTLAQVKTGIWLTQKLYFESFFIYFEVGTLKIPYFPGGYTLGGLLMINLCSAFIVRFKPSVAKAGIYFVHIGFITLLVSELMTDILSVESNMNIDEGGRANYSESYRDNELVFIDRSPAEHDTVHSIPVKLLKPGVDVAVPDTPLTIRTVSYYPNAKLGQEPEAFKNPATEGFAVRMNASVTPVAVDYSDKTANAATAYVEVLSGEDSLGVWLVSNIIDDRFPPQVVNLGDQSWEFALRFKRHYHPFEMELIDFKHDKYPGTQIPFNFSSEVIVHPHDSETSQKALIYMNHPLRYAGLTFYQASFSKDELTTILQVVRNPGWILPYISVALMGFGMTYQFLFHFVKFLNKRRR